MLKMMKTILDLHFKIKIMKVKELLNQHLIKKNQ
jgi:hypothetical protein